MWNKKGKTIVIRNEGVQCIRTCCEFVYVLEGMYRYDL